eukprot:scaffold87554_cov32-Tisochrysis_lutea.AAC.3
MNSFTTSNSAACARSDDAPRVRLSAPRTGSLPRQPEPDSMIKPATEVFAKYAGRMPKGLQLGYPPPCRRAMVFDRASP